ncbi:GLUCM protein, partial [Atractosteus spatula]|nr:GLUCM protein [Atractosteus spatula]
MLCAKSLQHSHPAAIRALIRSKNHGIKNTSGIAAGYKQANIVILHKTLADDFEAFSRANNGPLPLLYRSPPGEWTCPKLAEDSDIRTDCPEYCMFENGNFAGSIPSLMSHSEEFEDMVTFYLGCSFSFEQTLRQAGIPVRNVEQDLYECENVSVQTSVPCCGVGRFQCPLVVTMRPVPEGMLDAATQATHPASDVHGAPVHIGYPGLIGVEDLSRPDYGDAVELQPGDVPVFWACGVTGVEAVRNCRSPLAFTHSPGCMFLSDCEEGASAPKPSAADSPLAFRVAREPLHYSLASASAVQQIRALETLIRTDPGQRRNRALFLPDELLKACLSLSHANAVLITTGFPALYNQNPPEETDGLPGALAMATMLQVLNKQVVIVTDNRAFDFSKRIIRDAVDQGVLNSEVPVRSLQTNSPTSVLGFLCQEGETSAPRYDHLVAIERASMAADGNYNNARKVNVQHLVDPIETLFTTARSIPGITTTATGFEQQQTQILSHRATTLNRGPTSAGVSNWGGYAVACALYILSCCPVHDRYRRKAVGFPQHTQHSSWASALPSVRKEEKLLEILEQYDVRSGAAGNLELEVDGLRFHDAHSSMIQRLVDIALQPTASLC